LAWLTTRARKISESVTSPSGPIVIETTTDRRSWPSPSEVRSVDSRAGSIGKISAAV